ncbi:Appr-1-p processing protein, partial [Tepidiphilus sp. B18-69]|nr:Appr-1-p processing protein [Tepidiphilus baoligensis]
GAIQEASAFLDQHTDSRERFERVTLLVEGFESPYGLELLSTVHWVMTREGVRRFDDVVASIHDWNPRKRRFTPRQIGIAIDRLANQGWLERN